VESKGLGSWVEEAKREKKKSKSLNLKCAFKAYFVDFYQFFLTI